TCTEMVILLAQRRFLPEGRPDFPDGRLLADGRLSRLPRVPRAELPDVVAVTSGPPEVDRSAVSAAESSPSSADSPAAARSRRRSTLALCSRYLDSRILKSTSSGLASRIDETTPAIMP